MVGLVILIEVVGWVVSVDTVGRPWFEMVRSSCSRWFGHVVEMAGHLVKS